MQREHAGNPNVCHPTAGGLPETCYSVLLSDSDQLIKIHRGVIGYIPIANTTGNSAEVVARDLNEGLTPKQIEAMKAGAMFGWDTPAADPAIYDDAGKAKPKNEWPEQYQTPQPTPLPPRRFKIAIELDERDTILAALRYWQTHKDGTRPDWPALWEIETNGDEHEGLDSDAIDELCERINCG